MDLHHRESAISSIQIVPDILNTASEHQYHTLSSQIPRQKPTKQKPQQGKIGRIMDLILQGLNPWSRYWGVSSTVPMLKTNCIQKCTAKSEHLSTMQDQAQVTFSKCKYHINQ